jgi:hypothetical protein
VNETALALRLLAALCTIGCLLAGLRLALRAGLRATAARGPAREIALLETLRLPDAAALHLIRAGDRFVVIGRAGSNLAAICEWSAPSPPVNGVAGGPHASARER